MLRLRGLISLLSIERASTEACRARAPARPGPPRKQPVLAVVLQGKGAAAAQPQRTNDPKRTLADIVEVATREFADKGLAGARIHEIAAPRAPASA